MHKIIRNIFVKNWGLKLFSFLLALVLWFTIIPDEKLSFEKSVTVPLETYNLPAGMYIVEKPPATIDVTIKAPHRLIDTIIPGTVRARLELSTVRVEQTDFPINRSMINLPQGAEVKEWSPNQVRMRLEKTKEIMMEVVPDLVGKLPENLELVGVEVIPDKVSIIGPESKVKEADKVVTSPIYLSSLTESIAIETDLILPDPDLRVASIRTIITVKLTIEPKKLELEEEEEVPEKKKRKTSI